MPLLAVWLGVVALGAHWLYAYGSEPGPGADPPATLPAGHNLPLEPGRGAVVMFMHPQCPCTRASLREIERVLARVQDAGVQVVLVLLADADVPSLARGGGLWPMAERLGGATVVSDEQAGATRTFGVSISGHVLYYDGAGQLRFSGGVTASRGHEGRSYGQTALEHAVTGVGGEMAEAPVYGCPIITPAGVAHEAAEAAGGS
ncbi:MAG: hypothetical protein WD009_06595 [Phycisphaeraceae bacterium]